MAKPYTKTSPLRPETTNCTSCKIRSMSCSKFKKWCVYFFKCHRFVKNRNVRSGIAIVRSALARTGFDLAILLTAFRQSLYSVLQPCVSLWYKHNVSLTITPLPHMNEYVLVIQIPTFGHCCSGDMHTMYMAAHVGIKLETWIVWRMCTCARNMCAHAHATCAIAACTMWEIHMTCVAQSGHGACVHRHATRITAVCQICGM